MTKTKIPAFRPVRALVWRGFVAGFYEGEGNVIHRGRFLRAAVGQKDRFVLDWMAEKLGGRVYGKLDGMHQWILNGAEACKFLLWILPYLSPRRQAQINSAVSGWLFRNTKRGPVCAYRGGSRKKNG